MVFLQGALSGLASGGLYAVLAICLSLMSRLIGVVNFSQTSTAMFGAYCGAWLVAHSGWPVWASLIVAALVGTVFSSAVGWLIGARMSTAAAGTKSALTVGPLMLLISIAFIVFGNRPQRFVPLIAGPALEIGGVVVTWVSVTMVVMALVLAVAGSLVLTRTRVGVLLRALSDRPITAELLGIQTVPLSIAVWATTGFVASVAVSIVAPTVANDAAGLSLLIVPATAAALLGGLSRLDLAVVGGLLLGVLDGVVAQVQQLSPARGFAPFIVIVAVLLWRQRKEVWDEAR